MRQQRRPPGSGPDLQVAAELPQAGAACPECRRPCGDARRCRRPASCPGRRHGPGRPDVPDELRADIHPRGSRVAMDIGERLLHHPQDRALDLRRSVVDGGGDPDPRLQSRAPREPVDELPQRRLQSLVGEIGRMEQVGEDAQLQKRPVEQVPDLVDRSSGQPGSAGPPRPAASVRGWPRRGAGRSSRAARGRCAGAPPPAGRAVASESSVTSLFASVTRCESVRRGRST